MCVSKDHKLLQSSHLQDSGTSKVATITEVRGSHHVLWVVHLLSQLWDADCAEMV